MSIIPLLIACLAIAAQRLRIHRAVLAGVGAGAAATVASSAGLLHN